MIRVHVVRGKNTRNVVDGARDITKKIGARRTIKLKFKNFFEKIVKHIEKTPDW